MDLILNNIAEFGLATVLVGIFIIYFFKEYTYQNRKELEKMDTMNDLLNNLCLILKEQRIFLDESRKYFDKRFDMIEKIYNRKNSK